MLKALSLDSRQALPDRGRVPGGAAPLRPPQRPDDVGARAGDRAARRVRRRPTSGARSTRRRAGHTERAAAPRSTTARMTRRAPSRCSDDRALGADLSMPRPSPRARARPKAAIPARAKTEIGRLQGMELTSIINMIDRDQAGAQPLVDLDQLPRHDRATLDSGPRHRLASGPATVAWASRPRRRRSRPPPSRARQPAATARQPLCSDVTARRRGRRAVGLTGPGVRRCGSAAPGAGPWRRQAWIVIVASCWSPASAPTSPSRCPARTSERTAGRLPYADRSGLGL